jgi:5'-nucleotidase
MFYGVSGTPVASALYGIDVAAQARFGKQADLVISGPNFGNNTGLINNSSGTVNAALIAINRGVPAIAVSAADPTTYRSFRTGLQPIDVEIADVVVRLVTALDPGVAGHRRAGSLLPAGIGLNVNVPRFAAGTGTTLPFRLSEVGTAPSVTPVFLTDLCADATAKALLGAACAGATPPKFAGVGLVFNGAPFPAGLSSITDNDPRSEQNVVNAGAVAVSVIEGNHEAPRAAQKQVARGLRGLLERSPEHAERDDD